MNRNSWFVIVILAVSAVLMTIGIVRKIQSLRSTQKQVIAVIPKGAANMWWEVVHKGAEKAGKETGFEIAWNGPELETDPRPVCSGTPVLRAMLQRRQNGPG